MKLCIDTQCRSVKQLVRCPVCEKPQSTDNFGICRSRPSGRNLYCKACIREKVQRSRVDIKKWRQLKRERRQRLIDAALTGLEVIKPSAEKRVIEAIESGARTQKEIRFYTRLTADEIADVICVLLLWRKQLTTIVHGDSRMYFLKARKDVSNAATA